jgi:two-component system, LytTR family, response regulator
MGIIKRISTVIIDNDEKSIFALQSYLELMPEVEIKGTATDYRKAIKLISLQTPDLVFLDIEMPGKTGFEILKEFDKQGLKRNFDVIFLAANDKYILAALRENVCDFLLKPPRENEIKEAIQRYQKQKSQLNGVKVKRSGINMNHMVSLPTNRGLQFLPKDDIVYVECQKQTSNQHSFWLLVLRDHQLIKLHLNSGAISIINHLGADSFIALSQSLIVNVSYINRVEYKTLSCYLHPPFDVKPIKISRQYLVALRDRFDLI